MVPWPTRVISVVFVHRLGIMAMVARVDSVNWKYNNKTKNSVNVTSLNY